MLNSNSQGPVIRRWASYVWLGVASVCFGSAIAFSYYGTLVPLSFCTLAAIAWTVLHVLIGPSFVPRLVAVGLGATVVAGEYAGALLGEILVKRRALSELPVYETMLETIATRLRASGESARMVPFPTEGVRLARIVLIDQKSFTGCLLIGRVTLTYSPNDQPQRNWAKIEPGWYWTNGCH